MECKPNPSQTSPDCWQIALMGEYGAAVYGSRGDDTGNHPSYDGAGDMAISTCAAVMITGAFILAMIMIRAEKVRRR